MKIIFLGTPDYLGPIIKSLGEHFDLIKVIRDTKDLNNEAIEQLNNLKPDLLVVASFGKIIPQEILEFAKLGAINIHPSKLPKYRGPSPIQSQILDGVTDSAISFILMDSEMDHGPIIFQEPFTISETDTFESLCNKMFAKSAQILPQIIQDLAKEKITPRLQQHAIATYCNHIKKEDGYFDINNPPDAQTLDKMIRAYSPWPGAYTKWNGKIVKLLPSVITREEVQWTFESTKQSQSKYLIQMEGKKAVPIKDFLNGYSNFPLKNLR